jgi:hypothetical protein
MRTRVRVSLREGYVYLEDHPLVVVLVAGAVTAGVALVLAWQAGWPRLSRVEVPPVSRTI